MNIVGDRKKIFVGVSGGVDSSVSAALLQEQGHDVTGVFIRTWQPDWLECTWRDERRDAMRVCAYLNIPFVELDLEQAYKTGVADYMIAEYKKGRTPNPDVMCNREVKFGAFLDWARKQGADAIATGHYARTNHDDSLLRGIDHRKDQSYFLWTLAKKDLASVVFPVGHLEKDQVRIEAERFGLPTASKKDSQGICFLGDIDMKDFLGHYIDEQSGEVLNTSGEMIGSHKGALFFTLGERHGFSIHPAHKGSDDHPHYVVAKDIEANTITVSQTPQTFHAGQQQLLHLSRIVDRHHIFAIGDHVQAQIRYRGELLDFEIASVDQIEGRQIVKLKALQPNPSIAPGQSLVCYDEETCLAGGIIDQVEYS